MANEITLPVKNVNLDEESLSRERKRKSTRITIGVHALLLLLAFFMRCEHEKAAENQYAVAINFEEIIPPPEEKLEEFVESSNSTKSQSSEGAPKETADKPAEIEEVEQKVLETTKPEVEIPKPTPDIPTPIEEIVSETVSEEESDVTAVEEDIEIAEPELEPVPDPEPDPEPIPDPDPTPRTNPGQTSKTGSILDILKDKLGGSKDEGNKEGDPSRSDGEPGGTGKGDSGTGKGSDASGNDGDSGRGDGGLGEGEYDGSGAGVFGRKVIYRNPNVIKLGFENQEGKIITVKVCVDRAGNVRYAELLDTETNAIMTRAQAKKVIFEFKKYKYEEDFKAPKEQCGKIKLRIQNINTLHGG